MTTAEALMAATARLQAAGVPDPARDARVLLAHTARVTLITLEDLSPDIAERYEQLIALRSIRIPVSHLVGERDFYGRRFKVSRDVLDPRPETETLVEAALAEPFGTVLDLGVGSGCILVTLLAERQTGQGTGVDLSEAACLQASANAVLHRVSDRARIVQSDWFNAVSGRFDLIISNPPYIPINEMPTLADEVRFHEPEMAVTDGADGLIGYRAIASSAPDHLVQGGRVLVEVGPTQAGDVCEIFTLAGLVDLDGRDRVVIARLS